MLKDKEAMAHVQWLEDTGILYYDNTDTLSLCLNSCSYEHVAGCDKTIIYPFGDEGATICKFNNYTDINSIQTESINYAKAVSQGLQDNFAATSSIFHTKRGIPFIIQEQCVCPSEGIFALGSLFPDYFTHLYQQFITTSHTRVRQNHNKWATYAVHDIAKPQISNEEVVGWLHWMNSQKEEYDLAHIILGNTQFGDAYKYQMEGFLYDNMINDLHPYNYGWSKHFNRLVIIDFNGFNSEENN